MVAYADFLTKVLKVESGVVARRIVYGWYTNCYIYPKKDTVLSHSQVGELEEHGCMD